MAGTTAEDVLAELAALDDPRARAAPGRHPDDDEGQHRSRGGASVR